MKRAHIGIALPLALLVLVADQASKWWVGQVLDLPALGHQALWRAGPFALDFTMVWNRGVTFGLLSGESGWHQALLAGIAGVIVVVLLYWLWRAENRLTAAAIGALVGGAIGNSIDRLRWGAVFDFLHAQAWGWSWYVFNVADAAIVLGVVALVFDSLFRRPAAA
ncbi:signal peptidase II [Humitalea rosea]|uniref:Lipoprotein signal peptidase n=1 Tax=Humitalea rosea TaxID=990373 RepID=A0A2W7HYV3_9PROT|nr:signal peptidase II [Humitalea rosea]PZW37858.1 signal peptidase II [Humitalea rosea]